MIEDAMAQNVVVSIPLCVRAQYTFSVMIETAGGSFTQENVGDQAILIVGKQRREELEIASRDPVPVTAETMVDITIVVRSVIILLVIILLLIIGGP